MPTRIAMYDIFHSNLNSLKLKISQMASIKKNQDISLQIMTSVKTVMLKVKLKSMLI